MDTDVDYAAHPHALMRADNSVCNGDRRAHLAPASPFANQISTFQRELGAAAACAWSMTQFSAPSRA